MLESRKSVTLQIPTAVLDELDALTRDVQAQSPGRIVRRSETLRDVIVVGLRERQRKRKTGGGT